ncbi:hypothetical protein [Frigoribacterium sp. UYMn621]|uniref:hypothetical protein n=1 Tax=Frigoribacterium sp. UYMn621 TaxID=3156343 RepID=UPI003395BEF1
MSALKKLGASVPFSWEMLAGPCVTEDTHTWTAPTTQEVKDFNIWHAEYRKARNKLDKIEKAGGEWFWGPGGYDYEPASVNPPKSRWVKK